MEAVFASLIAVTGTLLGAALAYLFQQRATERTEAFARSERLRTERLAAYSAFAAALTDHRRAVVNVWLRRREDPDGAETAAALAEADRVGAAIDPAIFRVHLMTDEPTLVALANAAHLPTLDIERAQSIDEVRDCEDRSRDAIGAFILAVAQQVR